MKWLLSLLFASFVAGSACAQETPDVLVKNVTNEVLEIVRKDKDIQAGNTKKAVALVEAKVLPHFNFDHMTQLAVGRNWTDANATQRKALVNEFRTLLVRTYSKALTEYRKQTIEFKPFAMKPGETDVMVRTQIPKPGSQPTVIDYSLEKVGTSWKVYDIAVAGVSLVTNYRGSFAEEVTRSGIDGLIASLQTKNKSGVVAKK